MSPESALAARDAAGLADEAAPALIGPHAVIHLAEVMREDFGPVACARDTSVNSFGLVSATTSSP